MKTAIVTGASRGLGRALLHELVSRGVRVVGVARSPFDVPEGAHAVVADVSDPDAAARIAGEATERVGPIDLVVHNASTLGPTPLRPLAELGDTEFDDVVSTNLAGPFRLTRRLLGQMVLRGAGTVAFVSSDAAVEAYPTWAAYGATKAAADHLARVWAAEVPEVRFVSFDPGEMDTAMHADALPDADRAALQRPADVARRLADLLEAR